MSQTGEITENQSHAHISDVVCIADFNQGVDAFVAYQPVKVLRDLKEAFNKAISDYFVNNDIDRWESTQTPLKLYWKFKRV